MGTSGDGFSGLIDPIGTGGTAANGAPQLRFFLGSNSGTFKRCVSNCTDPNAAWPTVGGSFTADQQSFVLPVHLFHGGIPGGDDCPPAGPSGGCGHLLAGTTRVWETITGSAPQPARGNPLVWYVTNNPTTANLTKGTLGNRSFINQVKYSPKYQSVAIVGTNDANVQIGFNLGTGVQAQATWVNVTGGNSVLPNRPVMGIALAPNSTDRTLPIGYAVEGGFSDNTPGYPGHVFRVVCTANCSSFTWTDKSGNLPDIPFDSVIVNPNFPSQIFAGSDFGLYYTDDVTANPPVWKRFNNGLPNVMVWDMAVDRGSTTLALFTRSRGVYVWPLPLGPENPLPTTLTVNPASGPYGGTATLTASLTSGGNPVAGKTIAFSLNGANLGTGTTDSIGNASIIANLGTIPPGTYPGAITASFAGDSTDAASTGSGTLTVTPGSGTVVLVPSATLVKNADGSYTALVTIKNNGTGYAMNVVLTTATLGAATGAPLPQTLGNIAPGGSVITTVTYPSSAGASHAAVIEKYAGTYTGSGFTASLRATLP
jgi:hypothetical protein